MKKLLKNIAIVISAPFLLLLLPFFALADGIKRGDGDDIRSAIKMMGYTAVGLVIVFLIGFVS